MGIGVTWARPAVSRGVRADEVICDAIDRSGVREVMRRCRLWRAILILLASAGGLAGCYYDPYTGAYYSYPPYAYPYRPPYPYPYPAPPPTANPPPANPNGPVEQTPLPPP